MKAEARYFPKKKSKWVVHVITFRRPGRNI
jgi:hypothetical protein